MRLWRLTTADRTALDGAGALEHGGRYSPPGAPVVHFASEAGLAVLIALRYSPSDADEYVLGWTEIAAAPERIPNADTDEPMRAWVAEWLSDCRSLLAALPSRVLPEADVVLMNPLHPAAIDVSPLVTRQFNFADCLHAPPMLERYSS
jgi:RES domain-containing protein